jgi:hypothetical protein
MGDPGSILFPALLNQIFQLKFRNYLAGPQADSNKIRLLEHDLFDTLFLLNKDVAVQSEQPPHKRGLNLSQQIC